MLPVCEAFRRLNEHALAAPVRAGEGLLTSLGTHIAARAQARRRVTWRLTHRRRMYLTPQMEAIASEFLEKILLFKDVSGNDNLINFLDVLERRDIRWSERNGWWRT